MKTIFLGRFPKGVPQGAPQNLKVEKDFYVTGCYEKFNTIRTQGGETKKVTDSQLKKMQQNQTWATDF